MAKTKFKPILFSTPMVEAILNGTKTQTRRVIKKQPYKEGTLWKLDGPRMAAKKATGSRWSNVPPNEWEMLTSPYGSIGDVLWVRETFIEMDPNHYHHEEDRFAYRASTDSVGEEIRQEYIKDGYNYKWKPSIFMPKEACRIFLEIVNVRIERLNNISEEDSKAEGVLYYGEESDDYKNYQYNDIHGDDWGLKTAKGSFMSLWASINGEKSWNSNPWVWVIEFKQIEKPKDFK